jgi:peptidoglycan/LPS O-acetylase OafA/YrhL
MNKNNNFDFLRFLFAILVVISHAYPLSGDNETSQWIYQITNGQMVLASIGLNGFFIISGFFIFHSLQRSTSLYDYYKKRLLRLFPALFILLLITVILAPFVYKGTIPFYYNREVYTYLPNNLSLYNFQSGIKGIFDKNNYHAINGSLWTIRYEFSLYIALSLLFFFRKKTGVVRIMLFIAFAVLYVLYNFFLQKFAGFSVLGMQGLNILNLGAFFVCGSLLAALQFENSEHKALLFIAVLIFILAVYFHFYDAIKHLILPIIILLIGFMPLPFFSTFGKYGDMSYGVYIYSFPVQQVLMHLFKLNSYELMISSLIFSILFAYLSWHLIEKKALKYKNITIFEWPFVKKEPKFQTNY